MWRASMMVGLLLALPAAAQDATGKWVGEIRCAAAGTLGPLRAPFTLTVAGGQARYERPVFNPTDASRILGNESGGGAVAADGTVKLTGNLSGPSWRQDGSYEGRLTRPSATLTGAVVNFSRSDPAGITRPCRITLAPG